MYIATGHVLLFLILPVVMVQTIKHTHSTRQTGICIISPYPTPRDLRGRCLHCFNYSGKPGISPVWCACPVAWRKTHACPQLKVLTNAHTHTHTHKYKILKYLKHITQTHWHRHIRPMREGKHFNYFVIFHNLFLDKASWSTILNLHKSVHFISLHYKHQYSRIQIQLS